MTNIAVEATATGTAKEAVAATEEAVPTVKNMTPAARTIAIDEAMARSGLYGFLALIYRQEPTQQLLEQLEGPAYRNLLLDIGIDVNKDIAEAGSTREEVIQELAVEYAHLFIGPGKHISPYESVYTEGGEAGIYGKATVAVKHFIESVGYEYQSEFHGLPDHICVELEFLQSLTCMEAHMYREHDPDAVNQLRIIQKDFINMHMVKWVPVFCKEVIDTATLSFYRAMARLTADFLALEIEEANGTRGRNLKDPRVLSQ